MSVENKTRVIDRIQEIKDRTMGSDISNQSFLCKSIPIPMIFIVKNNNSND